MPERVTPGRYTDADTWSQYDDSDPQSVLAKTQSKSIRVAPTVTAGAYSAGDVVGGVLTFADAARASGGCGMIQSVVVTDRGNVGSALKLILFSGSPSSAIADNGAFAWGTDDADMAKYQGEIDIASTDYTTLATKKVATIPNVGLLYACDATSLYGYLVCSGTPTYAATTDLAVRLGVLRD